VNGIFQALFFAKIVGCLGQKRAFVLGISFSLPMFLVFPIISLLARRWGLSSTVWALVVLQLSMYVLLDVSYGASRDDLMLATVNCPKSGCIFMFITSSAPNRRSLGATNGLAQTTVSFCRAVGPAASTSLFAYSREHRLMGGNAAYVVFAAFSFASVLLALWLPGRVWAKEDEEG
jgi:hypothetical protein